MTGGHRLTLGEGLRRQSLTSLNDAFTLKHFGFEDLILFRNHDRKPLWWSVTPSPTRRGEWPRGTGVSDVALQADGNLVAHDENGVPLWATNTAGLGADLLEVRGDGDVVLVNARDEVVWSTGTTQQEITPPPFPVGRGDRLLVGQCLGDQSLTSPNGKYVLVHDRQHAGTFLHGPNGLVTSWSRPVAPTYPNAFVTRLVLEADGLFLRWDGTFDGLDLWGVRKPWHDLSSLSHPFRPQQLVVRDCGDVELLDAAGEIMWRNGYLRDHPGFGSASTRLQSQEDSRFPERLSATAAGLLLPELESVPLVRTDFVSDEDWIAVRDAVLAPRHLVAGEVFHADVDVVNDVAFAGLSAAQLTELVPEGSSWAVLVVADKRTMTCPQRSVLVIALNEDDRGKTLRAVPAAIQEIENNLSLSNMDWEDFADAADDDDIVHPFLDEVDEPAMTDHPG
ncbi:hypothetical protein PV646_37530 [Streptomyces sp. ID05-26A]|nr:hypothetical protein [Streptomyces sp. ID05-26A]